MQIKSRSLPVKRKFTEVTQIQQHIPLSTWSGIQTAIRQIIISKNAFIVYESGTPLSLNLDLHIRRDSC